MFSSLGVVYSKNQQTFNMDSFYCNNNDISFLVCELLLHLKQVTECL